MTAHMHSQRVFLAYAIVAVYLTAIAVWTVVVGKAFIAGGSLPTGELFAGLGLSYGAYPLSKLTDRILKQH